MLTTDKFECTDHMEGIADGIKHLQLKPSAGKPPTPKAASAAIVYGG